MNFLFKQRANDFKTSAGFERLYRKHVGKLCRIAHNQVQDIPTAENIVQNVFCSLWERRDTLKLKGPIEHYLVRAVKLATMDHIRTQTSHRQHIQRVLVDQSDVTYRTDDDVAYHELLSNVNSLIGQLPKKCREVYELSRKKGLNNKEIASSLFISEKTVEAHLSKALKFLRSQLVDFQH